MKRRVPLRSRIVVDEENPIFSYENSLVIFCYQFENGLLCHSRKIPYFPNSLVIHLLLYSFLISLLVVMLLQENPIFSYVLRLVLRFDFEVLVIIILVVLVKYSKLLVILHSNVYHLLTYFYFRIFGFTRNVHYSIFDYSDDFQKSTLVVFSYLWRHSKADVFETQ